MDLDTRIKLTRQTLDTLETIWTNGGRVPEKFVLEFRSGWSKDWIESCRPEHGVVNGTVSGVDSGGFYRLTPKGDE